ncbi:MAG TPA: LruC domain-containing protein [Cyclobacteriaceae bacterium]|nr:LruC domain-containing protein [Cyclobacteriaceae bacterium]
MKKMYALVVLLGAVTYSCNNLGNLAPVSQSEFDYHSTMDVTMNVSFTDNQGNTLGKVPYTIASSPLFDSTTVLAQVSTGISGADQVSLNIPTATDTLFVKTAYNGIPTTWKVAVQDGTVHWNLAVAMNELAATEKSPSSKGGRVAALPYTINYIGTFDSQGRPKYLEPIGDVIDAALLSRINASLPETKNLTSTNPEYITSDDKSIEVTDNADVWITFIAEGAGYLNTLGYYVYDKNSPPQTVNDIKNVTIIFPNCSFPGSGGNLKSGDKVYLGKFSPGQMIGWVVFSNAFSGGQVTNGYWQLYSNQALNSFISNSNLRQQNVLLNDPGYGRVILGFEDIRRDNGGCDNDFNDVLFSISANPITAINTQVLSSLETPADADGDGVTDKSDAYPNDATRAYNQYFPAQNSYNILAYEDLWPSRGDYDFNDLVMAYNVQQVLNAQNKVVDLKMSYQLRAVGGSNQIGFGVQLPVAGSNLQQATLTPAYNGNSVVINGAETGQARLVFPFFDDAHRQIKASGGSFTNTVSSDPYVQPVSYQLNLTFASPVSQSQLGSAPYNSFIYVNDRSVEVHLPNQVPTDKADRSLFGQHADKSNPAKGTYYLTYDNKPWALLIPGTFDYPSEKQSVESTYNYFSPWATSKGNQHKDWYGNGNGYRNGSRVYSH